MASAATLLADLKFRAGVQTNEGFTDDQLTGLLTTALAAHNPSLNSIGLLPDAEGILVTYLAWADLCEIRAARFAFAQNTSVPSGFGQDRNTPYYKCMDMAKMLRKRYSDTCSALNISTGAFAPKISTLSAVVPEYDALTPTGEEPTLPAIALKLADGESTTEGTTYVLQWAMQQFTNFHSFELYHIVGSDPIYQSWNWDSTVFPNTPQINDSASLIKTITNESTRGVKVTNITKTSTNRFLLVVRSASDSVGYSNELVITYDS